MTQAPWEQAFAELFDWALTHERPVTIIGMDLPKNIQVLQAPPTLVVMPFADCELYLRHLSRTYRITPISSCYITVIGIDGQRSCRHEIEFIVQPNPRCVQA